MLTVQLAEGARYVPHVLLSIAKSPGSAPEIVTPYTAIPSTPPLRNVIDWGALAKPMTVDAKERLVGVTVAVDIVPVPESDTV